MMPKSQLDNARRQGQFEGQVLTTLTDIKAQIGVVSQNYANLDSRTRSLETSMSTATDSIRQMKESADKELVEDRKKWEAFEKKVEALEDYRNTIKGMTIALGIVSPVLTSVLTAWVIKILVK